MAAEQFGQYFLCHLRGVIMVLLDKLWGALAHPTIRLKGEFPWTLRTMSKQYVIGLIICQVGSLLPMLLLFVGLTIATWLKPDINLDWLAKAEGMNMTSLVAITMISFLVGFGLQLLYFGRCFHKAGLSFKKSMGLSLEPLGGRWWAVIWRALAAFVITVIVSAFLRVLLPTPNDPAANFVQELTGLKFVAFGILAVVAAPIFEELVFRGFLFNATRSALCKGRLSRLHCGAAVTNVAAVCLSAAVFAGLHMTLTGFPFLFVVGAAAAVLYLNSGTLLCPMLFHAINNLVAVLAMLLSTTT
ncbi:MAG: CPBP family intramembrane metalloprotease [Candidatus Melainabacteria bacterium]|nr:CPBP family intramembrane metalloprotease [Candidatus Melainabacteria bacterium]